MNESGLASVRNGSLESAFHKSSTVQFKGGIITDGGVDGQTISQRLETCYTNLGEALFSSGRYTESALNFRKSIGMCLLTLFHEELCDIYLIC